jgi:ribosomal protein L16 Arg81 hydroxylase
MPPAPATPSALRTVLGRMSTRTFFATYWEQRPALLLDAGLSMTDPLFSIHDIEELLSYAVADGSSGGLRLVRSRDGEITNHPVPTDRSGRPDIFAIYGHYYDGWTIIINGIHRRWKPLTELAVSLEHEFVQPVGLNLYITPANAQGFLPHVDGHDVFILQLDGAKYWEVFGAPVELPLERQSVRIDPSALGEPQLAHELSPGKAALYIPRGFVHRAYTSSKSSVHLTIGVHVYKWCDLLRDALGEAETKDVELRRALPPPLLRTAAGRAKARAHAAALLSTMVSEHVSDQVLLGCQKQLTRGRPLLPVGQFTEIDELDSVSLDSEVKRRAGVSCLVEESQNEASILFSTNVVTGPKRTAPALRFIARTARFRTRDLPRGISDASKLVIVRRLIREGLLARIR